MVQYSAMHEGVVQGIGFLGLAAFVVSYQMRSTRTLLFCQALGVSLFALQMIFLDATSGALSLLLHLARNILLCKYDAWKWVRRIETEIAFIAAFTLVMWLTWAGPASLLAWVASVVSTVGYWTHRARTIRLVNLTCASPCWIAYDIWCGSLAGVISESLQMTSALISLFRFGWQMKEEA